MILQQCDSTEFAHLALAHLALLQRARSCDDTASCGVRCYCLCFSFGLFLSLASIYFSLDRSLAHHHQVRVAKVAGLSSADLNSLERLFLTALEYDVAFRADELAARLGRLREADESDETGAPI
jgi:hypothetical protein